MKLFYALALLIISLPSYAQAPTITSTYGITGICNGVVYGNGVYVASAEMSNNLVAVYTSTDAKTWTPLPSDHVPPFGFRHLAFGNGVFVGVQPAGTLYSSTDGVNWTLRSSDVPGGLIADIKFLQGAFYAISGAQVAKSTDGINWAFLDLGISVPTNYNFLSIDYGAGQFVIAADIPADRFTPELIGIYRSPTGATGTWTSGYANADVPLSKMMWLKDRFYLFSGGTFVTSTDADNWAPPSPAIIDTLPDGTIGTLRDIVWPSGFVAGDSVYIMGKNYVSTDYSLQVSVDGTHFKSFYGKGMLPNGGLFVNGLYIIYGNGGVATSADGIHYQFNSISFTGLATNGSGYVAVGGGGMFSSPDFATWTDRSPETVNGLPGIVGVVYTGSKYLAAGDRGKVYTSNDGTSWTITPVPYSFQGLGYGAGRFVGAAYNDTIQGLVTSTDGINWQMADTNFISYYHIRYINGRWFALGISFRDLTARVLTSADGLTWQNITPAIGFAVVHYSDVMYNGTKYYFTGIKKGPNGEWLDFFTVSTTDPMNTGSYGTVGGITNPAPGTAAGDYLTQFGDFIYHNGQFVGLLEDRANFMAYLAYSSDGMSWTTAPLNGPEQARSILVDGETYRIVGDDGGRYSVSFSGSARADLLNFIAVAVPSGAGENSWLSWRTKNESNLAYFLVQHSMDTVHWDSIGKVTATGATQTKKNPTIQRYQFTHEGPPAGVNYYRLGLVDWNGLPQWGPVRKVYIREKKDIQVYPNPAKGVIHLQLPGAGPAYVIIYNSVGRLVRQQVVCGNNVSLNVQALRPGTYHLQVFQGGRRYNKEFIIVE